MKEENVINCDEENITAPFCQTYKKINKSLLKLIKDEKEKNDFYELTHNVFLFLMNECNVQEDITLNTAQLYLFLKNFDINFEIQNFAGIKTIECAKTLLQNEDETSEDYIKRIFENNIYLFLKIIKIAEIIVLLQSQSDLIKKAKALIEAKIILRNQLKDSPQSLISILKKLL